MTRARISAPHRGVRMSLYAFIVVYLRPSYSCVKKAFKSQSIFSLNPFPVTMTSSTTGTMPDSGSTTFIGAKSMMSF